MTPSAGEDKSVLLAEINRILFSGYGICSCPLNYGTPFQLLVATELSAQCTDLRVNQVTRELFKYYPDASSLAAASRDRLEALIRPAGLFRSKAENLIRAAQSLITDFGGEVPRTMDKLIRLAGIGRKSANVILGNAFGIPGFPVDTHVKRILNRVGLCASDDPEKIEAEVNAFIPDKHWTNLSHLLILHGRETCTARKPDCGSCVINHLCKYYRHLCKYYRRME
ncbi:MAG: endonuclease III [Victivallaceae bacterium]|nr:endonuclease III [Victivallaceae bacterium]